MINPKDCREQPEKIRTALKKRHHDTDVLDQYITLDQQWREETQALEALQQERNAATPKGKPSDDERARLSQLSQAVKEKQSRTHELEEKTRAAALMIPNITLEDVPEGTDESKNQVIREEGQLPEFSFTAKSHDELGQALGYMDFETAAALYGAPLI